MRQGGDSRRRKRAAAALVALTLLPAALMMGAAHRPATGDQLLNGLGGPHGLRTQDVELPAVEAFRRGQASNLFAPFVWDGLVSSGPFVQFGFVSSTGSIVNYASVSGLRVTPLVDSIQVSDFAAATDPLATGATLTIASRDVTVVAHDEPLALLEVRTTGAPHSVTIQLRTDTSSLRVSYSTSWPSSSLSFSNRELSGRIIIGHGNLTISGTTVTASLRAEDYLAIRALPGFLEPAAEYEAILDAFASGRLAAEIDLVAVSTGGWIENLAEYHATLGTIDRNAGFGSASLQLGLSTGGGGLVLLAFDPKTMPVDSMHRLVLRENTSDVPKTSDPLASMLSPPEGSDRPEYAVLPMNATVLAVYVPDLNSTNLEIQSIELPPPGMSRATQLAIVAAMFVVAVAAVIMFRRRRP